MSFCVEYFSTYPSAARGARVANCSVTAPSTDLYGWDPSSKKRAPGSGVSSLATRDTSLATTGAGAGLVSYSAPIRLETEIPS